MAIAFFFAIASPSHSFAQSSAGPSALNISGGLYYSSGKAIEESVVNFKLDVYDKTGLCLLYTETHVGEDLKTTRGGFSLVLGAGSSKSNKVDSSSAFNTALFVNSGSAPAALVATGGACATMSFNAGDERVIRVSYAIGSGNTSWLAMNPDVPIVSSAYAMVADTLRGKAPSDFIQANSTGSMALTQANVESIFNGTNFPQLQALLAGTSSQYLAATPTSTFNMNSNRIANLAMGTSASDATNKGYVDARLAGSLIDTSSVGSGVGNGRVVMWDATLGKWTTGLISTTDATKLPLAGGAMSGAITMGTAYLQFANLTSAQETSAYAAYGTAQAGAAWFNTSTRELRVWNGTAALTQAYLNSSGYLQNNWVQDYSLALSKLNSGGGGANRLLITDNTSGATVTYATCGLNQVLAWSAIGWSCTDPVITVNGSTGAVVINAGNLPGLGSIATYNQGTASGQVVALDGSARFPAVDGSQLTNVNATRLQGFAVSSSAPSSGTVLGWNVSTSRWEPTSAANGSVTNVATGTGLIGGPITSTGTIAVDIGVTAGKVVALDGSARLPAVDGSLLTNVVAVKNVATGTGLVGGPITNTGTIAVNIGTGSGQVVALDGSSRLPAVNGSLLTNVNAVQLQGQNVAATVPSAGTVLGWNVSLSRWEPIVGSTGSVVSVATGTGLVGGPVTTNGTIAVDIGTTAGKVVALDASARLPAVDGSQLLNTVGVKNVATGTGLTGGPITSNGTIAVNIGTGSGQVVALDGSSRLPAVNGSLLTNVNAIQIQGRDIASTAPASAQVLAWNTSANRWEPVNAAGGSVSNVTAGSGLLGGSIVSNGTISVDSGTVAFKIVALDASARLPAVDGSQLTNLVAVKNVATGTGLTGGPITSNGTIAVDIGTTAGKVVALDGSARLPAVNGSLLTNVNAVQLQGNAVASGVPSNGNVLTWNTSNLRWESQAVSAATNSFVQNGNSFGALASLGTNDAYPLNLRTAGTARLTIDTTGNIGIGTTVPQAGLDIATTGLTSAIIVPRDTTANRPTPVNGMLRYNASTSRFEGYENGVWVNMSPTGAGSGDFKSDGSVAMTGTFKVAAGSAGSPSITFNANQTTGIYQPGSGTMSFATAGAQRMTIDAAGSVGIGTATPANLLTVKRGTNPDSTGQPSGTFAAVVYNATNAGGENGLLVKNNWRAGSSTAFEVGNDFVGGSFASLLKVDGFGYVGINNSTPNYTLDISGAANVTGSSFVGGSLGVGTTSPTGKLDVITTGTATGVRVLQGTSGDPTIALFAPSTATWNRVRTTGNLQIFTSSAKDAASTPDLSIQTNGAVGVGTSTPQALLDISGTGTLSSILIPRDTTANRPSGVNGMIRYNTNTNYFEFFENGNWVSYGTTSSGVTFPLLASPGTTPVTAPSYSFAGDSSTGLQSQSTGSVTLVTAGTARLHVTSLGRVGIGTTTPASSLEVTGTLTVTNNMNMASGTVTNPGLYFQNANLGFWRPGTGILALVTNGAERWRVDAVGNTRFGGGSNYLYIDGAAGNIGMGTATPQAGLDVAATGTMSAIIVPRETAALRPNGVNGMLRYNTSTSQFEFYQNNAWVNYSTGGGGAVTFPMLSTTSGSASAPAYSFASDSDTGLFGSTANTLALATGGTSRLFIDSSGNVGVGTTSPGSLLNLAQTWNSGATTFTALKTQITDTASNANSLLLDMQVNGTSVVQAKKSGEMTFSQVMGIRDGSYYGGLFQNGYNLVMFNEAADYSLASASAKPIVAFNVAAGAPFVRVPGAGQFSWSTNSSDPAQAAALTLTRNSFGNLSVNGFVGTGAAGLAVSGFVGVANPNPQAGLDVATSGTGSAIIVPRDTAANRPNGINGMLRYNTSTSQFEFYQNNAWVNYSTGGGGGGSLTNFTESVDTSGPNATIPAARLLATNAAASTDFVLSPKGSGSLLAQVPDNAVAGGNKRGNYSVDLQMSRTNASQVAAGPYGAILGGGGNTISSTATNSAVIGGSGNFIGAGIASTIVGGYTNFTLGNSTIVGATYGSTGNDGAGIFAGESNTVTGYDAVALGGSNNVVSTGYSAVLGGTNGTSAGSRSVVLGGFLNRTAAYGAAVVGGEMNTASAIHSVVVGGTSNFASGLFSVVGGVQNVGTAYAQAVFGTYNAAKGSESMSSWVAADPLFTVGNGVSSGSRSNALQILKNGNTGLSTTSPQAGLDIATSGTTGSAVIVPRDTAANRPFGVNGMLRYNTNSAQFEFYQNNQWVNYSTGGGGGVNSFVQNGNSFGASASLGTNDSYALNLRTAGTSRITIDTTGNVGIGTTAPGQKLSVAGTIESTSGGVKFPDGSTQVGAAFPYFWANGTNSPTTEVRDYNVWATRGNGIFLADVNSSIGNGIPNDGSWFSLSMSARADVWFAQTAQTTSGIYSRAGFAGNIATTAWNRTLQIPATSQAKFTADGSNNVTLNVVDNAFLALSTNNTERMRISAGGNVGVGTTNPVAALDVTGTGTNSAIVVPRDTAANRPAGVNGMLRYNTNSAQFEFYQNNQWVNYSTGGGSVSFPLQSTTLGTVGTPAYSFASSTNTGIYMPAAGSLALGVSGTNGLTVVSTGDVTVANNLTVTGSSNSFGNSNIKQVMRDTTGVATDPYNMGILASTNDRRIEWTSTEGSNYQAMVFSDTGPTGTLFAISSSLNSGANWSPRLVVKHENALVGIGTNNPQAALDVATTGNMSAIIVPRDTAALRPTGVNGMLRYNTSAAAFEFYQNNQWVSYSTGGSGGAVTFPMLSTTSGSASIPAYSFSADPDTGIYSSTANTLAFSTGGTARAYFDASGNLGLGTTAPAAPFDLSSGAQSIQMGGVGQAYIKLRNSDASNSRITADTNSLILASLNGNIQVGNADSSGNIPGTLGLTIGNLSSGYGIRQNINGQRVYFETLSTDSNTDDFIFNHSSGLQSRRLFEVQMTGSSRFAILPNGNAGFGTQSPQAGLDIATVGTGGSAVIVPRDTAANRPFGVNGMLRYNTSAAAFEFYQNNQWVSYSTGGGGSVSFPMLSTTSGSAANPAYSFSSDSDTGMFGTGANTLALATGGTARLILDGSGNIGINTAVPTNPIQITSNVNAQRWVQNTNTNTGAASLSGFMADNGSVYAMFGLASSTFSNVPILQNRTFVNSYLSSGIVLNTEQANPIVFGVSSTERMRIDGSGLVAIGTTAARSALDVAVTGTNSAILVPRDSTANRPAGNATNGMFRYNTSTSQFEFYQNNSWVNYSTGGGGVSFPLLASPNGSAAAPAYSFSSNSNTGMFLAGAGTIGLATNGVSRVTVDPNGNVGIGTTTPGALLQVGVPGGSLINPGLTGSDLGHFSIIASNQYLSMGASGSGNLWIQSHNSGTTLPLVLNPLGGQVGIGTSVPGALFEVAGPGGIADPLVKFGTTGNSDASSVTLANGTGAFTYFVSGGGNQFITGTNQGDAGIRVPTNRNLFIGDSGSARMAILSNGFVGIGTTSPAERLEVNGNIKATQVILSSDRRLKSKIRTAAGLESILKLRGAEYTFNSTGDHDMGVIAQEVEEVLPWVVRTDANGFKAVKYNALIAPLIESTKELYGMCKAQEEKVDQKLSAFERRIASLEAENEKLKSSEQAKARELEAMKARLEAIEKKLGIK